MMKLSFSAWLPMCNSAKSNFPSRYLQRGYLLEVPLLIVAALVIFAVVFPALPPLGQAVLLCLVAAVVIFGLYYMVVVPGWMPGDRARLRPPWNILVFVALAAGVVAVTAAFLLSIMQG